MIPARSSQRYYEKTRLMVVRPENIIHTQVGDLAAHLQPGDLLIVNRSGTMPSSFTGRLARTGEPLEIRLAAFRGDSPDLLNMWAAVVFGEGDWRMPTENRGPAPQLRVGDILRFHNGLEAHVLNIDNQHQRLIKIDFTSKSLLRLLYEAGRPIQYSYLTEDLKVWDQQTPFAGPPISVEPPSASFPLNWDLLLKLKKQGVEVASVLHGAGLSSTGDAGLDARLPLAEYFEVPNETRAAIERAARNGGRRVALGTTVTRAVESAFAHPNTPRAKGYTSLRLSAGQKLRMIDTLITGMHEPGTSHSHLMQAFCGCEDLKRAEQDADRLQYRSHEYGDLTLLDCKAAGKMGK